METLRALLEQTALGNSYLHWALAGFLALVCAAAALLIRRVVRRHYERLAQTEATEFMELPFEVASKTATFFIVVLALAAGLGTLEIPVKWGRVTGSVVTVVLFIQLGLWATTALVAWLERRR